MSFDMVRVPNDVVHLRLGCQGFWTRSLVLSLRRRQGSASASIVLLAIYLDNIIVFAHG